VEEAEEKQEQDEEEGEERGGEGGKRKQQKKKSEVPMCLSIQPALANSAPCRPWLASNLTPTSWIQRSGSGFVNCKLEKLKAKQDASGGFLEAQLKLDGKLLLAVG
jgi:hypothetical protein